MAKDRANNDAAAFKKRKAPATEAVDRNAGDNKKPKTGKDFVKGKPTQQAKTTAAPATLKDRVAELKRLWEVARQQNTSNDKRKELIKMCLKMLKGHVETVVFKHDTTRVVQTCLKYGSPDDRTFIFDELRGRYLELCQSRYGKFLAVKLLKYGNTTQRNHVFHIFSGKVHKMLRHKDASVVLEYAYNDIANETQRAGLLQELYSPQFRLPGTKIKNAHSIKSVTTASPENPKPIVTVDNILKSLRSFLQIVLGKNSLPTHTITQKLLFEYLTNCASVSFVSDMIENNVVPEDLVRCIHTRDGARCGVVCVTHFSSKMRKALVKALKGVVVQACETDFGFQVIIRILDVVDDTTLTSKAIISEITAKLDSVVHHPSASKVLLFVLAPTCKRHFSPTFLDLLRRQVGDEAVSKKPADVRRAELLQALLPPLYKYLTENVATCLTCPSGSQVLLCSLTHVTQEFAAQTESISKARDELIEAIVSLAVNGISKRVHNKQVDDLTDHAIGHRVFCILVGKPHKKTLDEGVSDVTNSSGSSIASLIWEKIKEITPPPAPVVTPSKSKGNKQQQAPAEPEHEIPCGVKYMLEKRGAFVLLSFLRRKDAVGDEVYALLSPMEDKLTCAMLKQYVHARAQGIPDDEDLDDPNADPNNNNDDDHDQNRGKNIPEGDVSSSDEEDFAENDKAGPEDDDDDDNNAKAGLEDDD